MSGLVRAVPTPGGGYNIESTLQFYSAPAEGPIEVLSLVLVKVRPVGTLEWGDLSMFVPEWVPELVEALNMAAELSAKMRGSRSGSAG